MEMDGKFLELELEWLKETKKQLELMCDELLREFKAIRALDEDGSLTKEWYEGNWGKVKALKDAALLIGERIYENERKLYDF